MIGMPSVAQAKSKIRSAICIRWRWKRTDLLSDHLARWARKARSPIQGVQDRPSNCSRLCRKTRSTCWRPRGDPNFPARGRQDVPRNSIECRHGQLWVREEWVEGVRRLAASASPHCGHYRAGFSTRRWRENNMTGADIDRPHAEPDEVNSFHCRNVPAGGGSGDGCLSILPVLEKVPQAKSSGCRRFLSFAAVGRRLVGVERLLRCEQAYSARIVKSGIEGNDM